jgi:hypothetical protein
MMPEQKMKKLIRSALRFCIISSLSASVMEGQEWIFYQPASVEAPYVLSRHYPISAKIEASEVITAKTFSINRHGSQVELTLSNATVFKTEITRGSSSNAPVNVKQQVMTADTFTMSFEKTEKIICDGKILEIGQYGIKTKRTASEVVYEGKAAVQYLKTNANGPGLPPGYDGH